MGSVVQLRPDAVVQQRERELTHVIGMMVALGSWTMMFAALFFMYLGLRAQALAWPPPGLPALPLLLPSINTVAIVVSSFTLARALRHLREGERSQALTMMGITAVLGITFVVLQVLLWRGLWLDGITTQTGTLGTVFYGLTVLHAVHVAAGLVVLGFLLMSVWKQASGHQLTRSATTLRLCAMFWHFVDAVWVLMFIGLFLV